MKKRVTLGIFLILIFTGPAVSRAQTPVLPEVKTYEELRHAISQVRAESRTRVEKAVEAERVREAWEIGKLIDEHVLQHKERADYDKQVISRLATDLGMSESELYRMLEFYRAYPNVAAPRELSWAHYRELLSLNDPKERETITAEAVKNKWSQKETREAIQKVKMGTGETNSPGTQELLPPTQPGKPGTYKIILAKTGPYAGELAIDLGFSNYVRLAEVVEDARPFKEGDIAASSQDVKGHYSLNALRPPPSSETPSRSVILPPPSSIQFLYTYQAWVNRVLDGDTIEAVVDLGFGITTTQTLRLRGLDAPELVSREGKEAKAFLEQKLRSAEAEKQERSLPLVSGLSVSPVLIKTVKSDKYDRYLVDIWTGETYVNQELLEKGMAVRVRE